MLNESTEKLNLLLIPAALTTAALWAPQEKALNQLANFHHTDITQTNSIAQMAQHIIETAPEKFAVAGFSLGGYVALELFRHIPERITGLALINSAGLPVSEKGIAEREKLIHLIEQGKFDRLIEMIAKNSVYKKEGRGDVIALLKGMAYEIGPDAYIKQLTAIINKPDHQDLLADIICPALVLTGKYDNVMPNDRSQHLAEHIPNSELKIISNCGHIATLEQAEIVNQAIKNWMLKVSNKL